MSIIYPKNPKIENKAEKEVYNKLSNFLEDNYITYYNYTVTGTEFDFCVLEKNKAIFIIEVKGWESVQIVSVEDNETIKYRDNLNNVKEWGSPFKQANSYKFNMVNLLKEKFNRNPLVLGIVCYPFISLKQYKEKRLDIISKEELTILQDDLLNKETLLNKLNKAFEFMKNNVRADELDDNLVQNIRRLYESDEMIMNSMQMSTTKSIENIEELLKPAQNKNDQCRVASISDKRVYSIVKYIKDEKNVDELKCIFADIIDIWKKGTKVYIISNNYNVLQHLKMMTHKKTGYLQKYDDFNIFNESKGLYEERIFNLSFIYILDNIEEEFEILDGLFSEEEKKYLERAHNSGGFNLDQYIVEHTPIKKDVCVRAGAGSGKTFSMVGRISYLIYKHKYTIDELREKIILITFTNEAADNMKKRLKKHFKNYFILIGDRYNFSIIETIEQMKICTIHSLCKKIISKYSSYLGLGKEISIKQGKHEKDKIINEILNKYIDEIGRSVIDDKLSIPMYELKKLLGKLLDKIEQKNIDLRDGYDFGNQIYDTDKDIHSLIVKVVKEAQEKLIELNNERSTLRLSNMIIKINELVKEDKIEKSSYELDYLFVDEFQDTDNMQIDLMKKFQKLFGFKFFTVGDIKQCIYRFRGAEDQAFNHLMKDDSDKWNKERLRKNYRTDKDLLDKFDPIFYKMSLNRTLTYTNEDKLIGTVNINSSEDKDFEKIDFENEKQWEDELIECVERERKILKKDEKIALLVRTNNDIEKIKGIFDRNKKPLGVEGQGDLYQIKPTIDLYKLVLALKHNQDSKYLFGIYDTCYTSKSMPKHDIYSLARDKEKLYKYFLKNCPIEKWEEHLKNLRLQPIMKVIRELINQCLPWEIYSISALDQNTKINMQNYYKRNLEVLIEIIINSFNDDYLTLNKLEEFLKIMIVTKVNAESRESLNIEEVSNDVICTTVHKSKGLEYDVVIMPICYKNIESKEFKGNIQEDNNERKKSERVEVIVCDNRIGYKIEFQSNNESELSIRNDIYKDNSRTENIYKMNEECRILYVAMTRSIRKFIYFNDISNTKKNKSWQKLIGGER
ncbi:UvrD-helicase domain-containing protein [Oceanirhabdus seepicola]|uniref:DNA 3'-5' helicase n=1 Tax=Oceanirhabdus seepicola TaxID=2828781 RepID=A0A9J6P083_9CLOT|nr:UvrD-helicase domain-containing protein [Oceanirhabdus seepicola]MCM1988832.1 UvrD-helicase domain-containing protein [Oceanirhabdus seepicola]